MRPPESFSTAAAKRFIHSCWWSFTVAVLSFMVITSSACAAGAKITAARMAKPAATLPFASTIRCMIFPLPGYGTSGLSGRRPLRTLSKKQQRPPTDGAKRLFPVEEAVDLGAHRLRKLKCLADDRVHLLPRAGIDHEVALLAGGNEIGIFQHIGECGTQCCEPILWYVGPGNDRAADFGGTGNGPQHQPALVRRRQLRQCRHVRNQMIAVERSLIDQRGLTLVDPARAADDHARKAISTDNVDFTAIHGEQDV